MNAPGILLYGYNRDEAQSIRSSFEGVIGSELVVISASLKEEETVETILHKGPNDVYEQKEDRIIMFLGFNREMVTAAMKAFPSDNDLKRPIFCGLTENNSTWKMNYLIEHLKEEKAYWEKKKNDRA